MWLVRLALHCEQLRQLNDRAHELLFSPQFACIDQGIGIGISNSIRNSLDVNPYVVIAGLFLWLHSIITGNLVINWYGILPMGHLFNTTIKAVKQHAHNQDARYELWPYTNCAVAVCETWRITGGLEPEERITRYSLTAHTTIGIDYTRDSNGNYLYSPLCK